MTMSHQVENINRDSHYFLKEPNGHSVVKKYNDQNKKKITIGVQE